MFATIARLRLWLAGSALVLAPVSGWAEERVRLDEQLPASARYRVISRTELAGSLELPPLEKGGKPQLLRVSGKSTVEYDERVLAANRDGDVERTLRYYQTLDFRRKAGEHMQESRLREAVRRMVLVRLDSEVPFSPDGPLTWSEIEQVRADVFTPALRGLLPGKAVRVGDRWKASQAAMAELTDLDEIREGGLECTFKDVIDRGRRRHARVDFEGTVTGIGADGPNQQTLEGYLLFDLQSGHISYLSLRGVSRLLDKDGKETGKLEGQFVLERSLNPDRREISDEALRRLTLEPNAENTLVLFDEPALGTRFVYPRRWTVRRADARQIVLDEPGGGGLLVTLEPPNQAPTAKQFQAEVEGWLLKQRAKTDRWEGSKVIQKAPEEVERFSVLAEVDKEPLLLDYYILRQRDGGATIAARFPAKLAKELQPEAERIAKSLRLVPPKSGPRP